MRPSTTSKRAQDCTRPRCLGELSHGHPHMNEAGSWNHGQGCTRSTAHLVGEQAVRSSLPARKYQSAMRKTAMGCAAACTSMLGRRFKSTGVLSKALAFFNVFLSITGITYSTGLSSNVRDTKQRSGRQAVRPHAAFRATGVLCRISKRHLG